MEITTVFFLILGALAAGFVNGFAGFGTALVASGFWFLFLPAEIVPALIIVCAVAGQLVGLWKLSGQLNWRKSSYLVSGGVFGVPIVSDVGDFPAVRERDIVVIYEPR